MKSSRLADLFDSVALLYNEVRPRYPEALFDDLARVTKLTREAKLLEIGPGTGQATKPMGSRGYDIVCVEPGRQLTFVLERELRNFPNVRVLTSRFEEASFPEQVFDLIYAATSFHWLEPGAQFEKPFKLLRENGHLAVIDTNHISDGRGDRFYRLSWPIYNRYGFARQKETWTPPTAEEINPLRLQCSGFNIVFFKKYPLVIKYDGPAFIKLLMTYSNHLAVDEITRNNFLGEIRQIIDHSFNNAIEKHYTISLLVLGKTRNNWDT